MPTLRQANPLSLAAFKGTPATKGAKVPARVRQLVELMVYGDLDAGTAPMSLNDAAKAMRIKRATAREYLRHAGGRAHYLSCLALLRDSERARNLHTAIEIRDDREMAQSAAGNRVRLNAASFLEGEPIDARRAANNGAVVMPGIVVHVSVNRGQQEVDDTMIEVNPISGALSAEG